MESTSESLLEQLRSPEAGSAWNRFVELYSPLIFHWGLGRRLPPEDAADLVQDVLQQMITQLPTFEYNRQQSFRGWLRTIVVNRATNLQRRSRLQPQTGLDGRLLEAAVADDDLFSETEYRGQVAKRLLQLIQPEFGAKSWKVAWLQIVEGAKPKEAAQQVGLSVNAAYVAKSRVLTRLRQALAGLLE